MSDSDEDSMHEGGSNLPGYPPAMGEPSAGSVQQLACVYRDIIGRSGHGCYARRGQGTWPSSRRIPGASCGAKSDENSIGASRSETVTYDVT